MGGHRVIVCDIMNGPNLARRDLYLCDTQVWPDRVAFKIYVRIMVQLTMQQLKLAFASLTPQLGCLTR